MPCSSASLSLFFFFQAEDGIRDVAVTGVQTCALPIWMHVAHRVQQFVHLALPGLYHAWIRMAGRRDAKGRCQIEILFTFGIPDMRVARPVPHHRPGTIRFDERDVARFVKAQEFENVLSLCFQSGGCRNTRSQTPNTKETPNPKHQSSVRRVVARLVFSAGGFSGVWCLMFGVFIHTPRWSGGQMNLCVWSWNRTGK